jgi:hypothetical protein
MNYHNLNTLTDYELEVSAFLIKIRLSKFDFNQIQWL